MQRFALFGQLLLFTLAKVQALPGIAAGQPELLVFALAAVALLCLQVVQRLLRALAILLHLPPALIQRLQANGRFTGSQAL